MMRFTASAPRRSFHQRAGRENAARFIEYATVTGLVAQVTDKALLLTSEAFSAPKWIPHFRMEVGSRLKAMRAARGREISIQVELEWALKEGIV